MNPISTYDKLRIFVTEYDSCLLDTKQYIKYLNISDQRKHTLIKQISEFTEFKNCYSFFVSDISTYITEYRKLLKFTLKSTSNGFSDSSRKIIDRKTELSYLIVSRIENLIRENMYILYPLYEPTSKIDIIGCVECGIENTFNDDNECVNCGYMDENGSVTSIIVPRNDNERKNRNGTEESILTDCHKKLMELQGKYNPNIPKSVFDILANNVNRIHIDDINKTLIRSKLKEAGFTSYYKYDTFLMKWLKKRADYDFTKEQTDNIMSEIKIFVQATIAIDKDMPDFNYLIFNILKRLNIPCQYEHFDLAKTEDKQTKQENLMRNILDSIGWRFYPFFY